MAAATATIKRLQIKKYPNRRYYDATRSQHVTLEQIYGLIREGYEIEVIDSKTNQDITAKILAQIIIELDSPKLGVFPVTMLHRLLQSNTEMVGDFIEKYFNQPLSAFMDSQRTMGGYFRKAMGYPQAPVASTDWSRMMLSPFNPAFWGGAGSAAPSDPEQRKANASDLRDEVEMLRRKLADLEQRAASPTSSKPRRNRT